MLLDDFIRRGRCDRGDRGRQNLQLLLKQKKPISEDKKKKALGWAQKNCSIIQRTEAALASGAKITLEATT